MELKNLIGEISDVQIISNDKRKKDIGGNYITFFTSMNISIDTYVSIIINDEIHYFRTTDISISGVNLLVDAVEIGYWGTKIDRIKDFDIRSLIGISVALLSDPAKIKIINQESCYT